jgi:hypothetical protein
VREVRQEACSVASIESTEAGQPNCSARARDASRRRPSSAARSVVTPDAKADGESAAAAPQPAAKISGSAEQPLHAPRVDVPVAPGAGQPRRADRDAADAAGQHVVGPAGAGDDEHHLVPARHVARAEVVQRGPQAARAGAVEVRELGDAHYAAARGAVESPMTSA